MHSKYDNIHKNGMFYALICINNLIIVSIGCMLSLGLPKGRPLKVTVVTTNKIWERRQRLLLHVEGHTTVVVSPLKGAYTNGCHAQKRGV